MVYVLVRLPVLIIAEHVASKDRTAMIFVILMMVEFPTTQKQLAPVGAVCGVDMELHVMIPIHVVAQ